MNIKEKLYLVNRESNEHGNWSAIYRTIEKATKSRDSNPYNKLYEFEFKGEVKRI